MKGLFLAALLAFTASANAAEPALMGMMQSGGHSANLTWTASGDGGTVSVYRAAAACSTNPTTFVPIKTGVAAAGPYVDSTITAGAWCYYITAVVQGLESNPSNKITLTVLPQPPSGLAGTSN